MTAETDQEISDEEALAIFESGEGFDAEHARNTPLGDIWIAREARDAADALLDETVMAARASGLSWDQIAVVLGMSRQGARKHYLPLTTSRVGDVAEEDAVFLKYLAELDHLVRSLRASCAAAAGPASEPAPAQPAARA